MQVVAERVGIAPFVGLDVVTYYNHSDVTAVPDEGLDHKGEGQHSVCRLGEDFFDGLKKVNAQSAVFAVMFDHHLFDPVLAIEGDCLKDIVSIVHYRGMGEHPAIEDSGLKGLGAAG